MIDTFATTFMTTFGFLVGTLATSGQGWILLFVILSLALQLWWVLLHFLTRRARVDLLTTQTNLLLAVQDLRKAVGSLLWATVTLDKKVSEGTLRPVNRQRDGPS